MINAKLIRIMTGEEVVAELVSETEDSITIKNGLVVIPQAQNVGFAPWATVISKDNPEITVSKSHVIYMVEVDESVRTKYNEIFGSKLVTPEEKKLII
jgi:hypothetical protein|tara:strand:- start:4116 stop:4409 length:294 start_codon:yes stop_codon:yes gene_type:complete